MTLRTTPRRPSTERHAEDPAATRRITTGTALAVLSAASFGVMPIITKKAYADGVSALGMLSARFTLAGLALLALARWRGEAVPRGRTLLALVALGGVGYATQSMCYFFALDHAPAGVVALLLYLFPGLVVVTVAVTSRRLPSRLTAGCLLMAVVGTALTVGPSGGADSTGIALALAAAVAYAAYILLGGRLLDSSPALGPIAMSAVVMSSAAATADVLALATGADYPRHAGGWAAIAAVALVCTVVAVTTFFAGLARIGPSRASIVSTVEPVVSVALGVVVLSEPLSAVQGLGAALVLGAVVMLSVRRQPTAAGPPT